MLRSQIPPMTKATFEENLRRSLMIDKLRAALTDWMAVSDAELEREFKQRNEKVKLQVVALTADAFRDKVTVTDADVAAHFDAHKAEYRVGEQRKIRMLLLDRDQARAKSTVPPTDVQRYYNNNIAQYQTPEQVRASHILLNTAGKDEAAVRKQAEESWQQVKGGRRLRGAGEEVLRGRGQQGQRRRPRLLRPRPHGAGVRDRGVRAGARPDQRPREDPVRLPHHQGGRQEGRRSRVRSTRCARRSRSS